MKGNGYVVEHIQYVLGRLRPSLSFFSLQRCFDELNYKLAAAFLASEAVNFLQQTRWNTYADWQLPIFCIIHFGS